MLAKAIISLLITLIGTGILSMFTLYIKVTSLSDSVRVTSEILRKHLDDSVSDKQYTKDMAQRDEQLKSFATRTEFVLLQKQLDDQTATLRRVEEKLELQSQHRK